MEGCVPSIVMRNWHPRWEFFTLGMRVSGPRVLNVWRCWIFSAISPAVRCLVECLNLISFLPSFSHSPCKEVSGFRQLSGVTVLGDEDEVREAMSHWILLAFFCSSLLAWLSEARALCRGTCAERASDCAAVRRVGVDCSTDQLRLRSRSSMSQCLVRFAMMGGGDGSLPSVTTSDASLEEVDFSLETCPSPLAQDDGRRLWRERVRLRAAC